MDPLYFFESHELLQFFHRHKTELSCMDKPQSFLFQLRDHDLIPKDISKKVIRMRIRENQKRAIYEMLDWFETERPKHIRKFWRCVFKETILNEYPSLRLLRNSLMDGSYRDDLQPFESVEDEELHENKKKGFSEDKEEEKSKKKKGKPRSNSVCDDVEEEEQPGPSAQVTPGQKKKPNKISFSSPLKIGEKNIWTWPIYKFQLPVTCGELEGTLNKSRLAKGEACILFQKQWFTPGEFENRAGKKSCKNWKWSIRCNGTTLGKLIQEGHLEAAPYKGGAKKTKKSLFPSDVPNTVLLVSEANDDRSNMVFKVTYGAICGTLHKKRFASVTSGSPQRIIVRMLILAQFLRQMPFLTQPSPISTGLGPALHS